MSTYGAAQSIRRSVRMRKSRSALELLGIERKRTYVSRGETDVEHSQFAINDCSRLDDELVQGCPPCTKLHSSHCHNDVYCHTPTSTVLSAESSVVGVVSCSGSVKSEGETETISGEKGVRDDLIQEHPEKLDTENTLGVLDPIVDAFGVSTTIPIEASESSYIEVSSMSRSSSSTILCGQINEKISTGSRSAMRLATSVYSSCTFEDQKQGVHKTISVNTAYNELLNKAMQSHDVEDLHTPVTSEDLNKLLRNKSGRALPVRHVVMGDELQRIVDNLQPKENIDDHVIYRVRKEGGKRRLMFCKYCEVQINHRHQFRSHIKSHREVDYRPYHCPLCDYKSQIKAQIARHINIHSTFKPYFCTECGREFNFKQKLQIHMKYHADVRDQTCPLCQVSFHEFKTLKNHIRSVHNVTDPKEFLRQRLTNLCDTNDKQDKCVDDSVPENISKLSKSTTVDVTLERSSLLELFPADGTVLRQVFAAAINCLRSGSASNEVCDNVLATDDETFSKRVSNADGREIERISPSDACVTGETGSFDVNQSSSGAMQSNEVYNSITSTAVCGKSSFSKHYEPPGTLMNRAHPKLLRTRRKSTIYGTCKTNIQTEMYRRRLSATGSSLQEKVRNLERKGHASRSSQKSKSNSRVLESVKVYCCSVAIRHPDYPDRDVLLACNICSVVGATSLFPTRTLFARHLENSHPRLKAWQCDQCSFQCRLRSTLIVHMKSHFDHNKQMCEFCGEIFLYKQKLMVHLRQHLDQREFKCHSCHAAFNERSQLRRHVILFHCEGRSYICNVCNKTYKEETQLRSHLVTHESSGDCLDKFQCDTCKKFYKNRLSLNLHLKSHSCVFRCEVCNKEFGSYSGFMSHKLMHIESHTGYQCEKCSKRLNTRGSMSRHYKIVHGSERPFACKQCPKMFKTKRNLESHGIVHNPDKIFECTTCSYQCKRLHSLRVHMRVHFAVKPYQCVLCQRQYTQKKPLDIHITRHVSKPTSCLTCGISFSTGNDVIIHLRTAHNHVVQVLPSRQSSCSERVRSVDGASQLLVASSFDNNTRVQEEELAAFDSYGSSETVDISNTATGREELRDEENTPKASVNDGLSSTLTSKDAVSIREEDGVLSRHYPTVNHHGREIIRRAVRFNSAQEHVVKLSVGNDLKKTFALKSSHQNMSSRNRNVIADRAKSVYCIKAAADVPDREIIYADVCDDEVQCEVAVIEITEDNPYMA